MKSKVKAAPVMSAINVIPMADIMLVLLIIFMVITPMLGPSIPVELAPALNPREMKDAEKEDALIVAITRDGAIYFGSKQVVLTQLREFVGQAKVDLSATPVFVKGDRRAKFGRVVAVVDELRGLGVARLGLLTEKTVPGG